jgi:hypothetical protein
VAQLKRQKERLPSSKKVKDNKSLFFRRLEGKKAICFFLNCSKGVPREYPG